ncbi:MAG: hydrolase [Patescibacteria group bacterium]
MKKADVETTFLMLFDEKSFWGSDIYIDVLKNISEAQMVIISGIFLIKVFEGSYKNMGKWINEMKEYVRNKEKEIKKYMAKIM